MTADGSPTAKEEDANLPVAQSRDAYVTLLFNRYRGSLHRYLSRLVSREEVPDLVQETYYRVLRADTVVQIDALARGLLFQTATNLAKDHRRRQASHRLSDHIPLDEDSATPGEGGPEERLASEQTLTVIEAALLRLPAQTRTIFVLSRFRGLSYDEIADLTELSSRTVARKMAEALDELAAAVGATQ